MIKKILFPFAVILLFTSSIWSQKDNVFPEERSSFIKEFRVFFTKGKSKQMENFFDDFEDYFKISISDEEFIILINHLHISSECI